MTISNKSKSMKKLNKYKLSKKSKKNKLINRLKNKIFKGGNKNYTYKHCKNVDKCYVEVSWGKLMDIYDYEKDIDIMKKLESNIIKDKDINDKDIYYVGEMGRSCLFTKGKHLNDLYTNEKNRNKSLKYLVDNDLVIDLINNNFLPTEYFPTNDNGDINL